MTEMTKRMILFSGSVNPELAEEIAKYLNVNLGNIKHEKFANGEIYARYQESIRGADVFLIQSVCASETFDVNDASWSCSSWPMPPSAQAPAPSRRSSRTTVTPVRTARPPRASPSRPSSWPICSRSPASTTSSRWICTRTPSRVSSTSP